MKRLSILLIVNFIGVMSAFAQVNVFATAKLDRNSVYPQQPIKASITVYTETWFTKPLNIENIQVSNAFLFPFKRTLSAMREINGKKYASLEFYYLIFPYQEGNYVLPEVRIGVESPPVGDYKGQSIQVNTQSLPFAVKELPDAFAGESWFVANDVSISEKWNRSLNDLKVGDVVERTIQVNAKGTLPNFIPDLNIEEEDFANVYKKSPEIEDKRSNQSANGLKSQTFLYLFNKSGTYSIPEVRIDWWNPYASRAYFKLISEQEITVAENPDLGMLATLQDSLSQVQTIDVGQQVTEVSWLEKYWTYVIAGILCLPILIYARRLLLRWMIHLKNLRDKRINSESYAFQHLITKKGQDFDFALHQWWAKFYPAYGLNPSFSHEFEKRGFSDPRNVKELKSFRTIVLNSVSFHRNFSTLQHSNI